MSCNYSHMASFYEDNTLPVFEHQFKFLNSYVEYEYVDVICKTAGILCILVKAEISFTSLVNSLLCTVILLRNFKG
jgi:hypothetical protein